MKPAPGVPIEQQAPPVVFAMGLMGEARGEGLPGMRAVAQSVMNRVNHGSPHRYGSGPKEVWLRPWQYSCFNRDDPNRSKMLDFWITDALAWEHAEQVTAEALNGTLPDTVGAATHYTTARIWGTDDSERLAEGKPFRWFSQQAIDQGITRETVRVGHQVFGTTA
jgi:N-acetylmuramoyl-L-alanine amidase